jgi:hypothetical protein
LPLPAFDASRDPLTGSFAIASRGPWLAIGYQGGVQMFSSRAGLVALAARTDEPLQRAGFLVHADQHAAAEEVLVGALQRGKPGDADRARWSSQLLTLVRERAGRLAAAGDLTAALREFDKILELMGDRASRLAWHLARVELCRDSGGLLAHEAEQQRLYDYMEGKS